MMATVVPGLPVPVKSMVAAIDFGTCFSGYAFSLQAEFERYPLQICQKYWHSQVDSGYISQKTPTAILLDSQQKFEAFGYEAETRYQELVDDNENGDYFFFRRFKMMLFDNTDIERNTVLEDVEGKQLPAILVFSLAISYLKRELLADVKDRGGLVGEEEIFWVITVPAIWEEPSKQFMREAAIQAGIDHTQLVLALEPEAASIYSKELLLQRTDCQGQGVDGVNIHTYEAGTQFMVVDLGGGTVDVTVREVTEDNTLIELHVASGCVSGGTKVDEAFRKWLECLVTSEVWTDFCQYHMCECLHLENSFEVKKRSLKPETNDSSRVVFTLPTIILELFQQHHSKSLGDHLKGDPIFAEKVDIKGCRLRIQASVLKGLFQETVNDIVDHLRAILAKSDLSRVSDVILVGGFSESGFVKKAVRDAFPSHRVVIPDEAGLAVLKGAVLFGHNPKVITARICKYTYGTEGFRLFIGDDDDPEKFISVDGKPFCKNVFCKHAEIGQVLYLGDQSCAELNPLTPKMTRMPIGVFRSQETSPRYTTDPGCVKIGELILSMPDTSKGDMRRARVMITFGDTELIVEGVDQTTGSESRVRLDLLNHKDAN